MEVQSFYLWKIAKVLIKPTIWLHIILLIGIPFTVHQKTASLDWDYKNFKRYSGQSNNLVSWQKKNNSKAEQPGVTMARVKFYKFTFKAINWEGITL